MELGLRIALVVGVLFYLASIFYLIKKDKLSVKYAIIWLLSGFVFLMFAIFPYIVYVIGDIVRIIDPVNTVFITVIGFIMLILLSLSSVASTQSSKIKKLVQTQSLLEKRLRELEHAARENGGALVDFIDGAGGKDGVKDEGGNDSADV